MLDVPRTAFFSVALLGSSFTLWRAERLLNSGHHAKFRLWLGLTIVLGGFFICGQAVEYYGLISSDVTIDDNLFSHIFTDSFRVACDHRLACTYDCACVVAERHQCSWGTTLRHWGTGTLLMLSGSPCSASSTWGSCNIELLSDRSLNWCRPRGWLSCVLSCFIHAALANSSENRLVDRRVVRFCLRFCFAAGSSGRRFCLAST